MNNKEITNSLLTFTYVIMNNKEITNSLLTFTYIE